MSFAMKKENCPQKPQKYLIKRYAQNGWRDYLLEKKKGKITFFFLELWITEFPLLEKSKKQ